jgi:hypothetical protein
MGKSQSLKTGLAVRMRRPTRYSYFPLLSVVATICCLAQQPSEPPKLQNIVWQPNHPGWDEILVDGHWFRTVYDEDGVGVKASVGTIDHYSAAVVTVFNHSNSIIEVRPENAYLYELKPSQRRFNEIDERKVEKSIGHRAALRAALVGFLGGMGSVRTINEHGTINGDVSGVSSSGETVNGTVSGSYESTKVVTDDAAAELAGRDAKAVKTSALQRQGLIAANALLPNSVLPGKSITGFIFFERATERDGATFNIVIGQKIYVLPFWFKK